MLNKHYLSFPTIVTSFGWVFAPALGWSVGSLTRIAACENLLPSAGRDLCGLATGCLGLLIGVTAASILTAIAIRRILPGIESKRILKLILGWVGGLALGFGAMLGSSPFLAFGIGMGCDVRGASAQNACIRAMFYFVFMISYVFMGFFGGITVISVLKQSEQHRREMSKRVMPRMWLPMVVVWLLLCCSLHSLIPAEQVMENVLSTPLIFWVSGGLALQGMVITRFLVSTYIRIQQAKFDSVSQV